LSDWQALTPYGVPQQGAPAYGGGGQTLVGYRDILDAKRSVATPRTPNAEWPDGYLGNINTRRSDRLLTAVQSRLTERSYQRGVHKGEKIDTSDYLWPPEFNPQSGLIRQSKSIPGGPGRPFLTPKQPKTGLPVEQINHLGKNHLLSPEQVEDTARKYGVDPSSMGPPVLADPHRQSQMAHLLPKWR
jgi:hypothetical protein